jgi:DNA-binding transcriptional ArsR family regulator
MNAFEVLTDPVRRRALDLLREREQTAGTLVERLHAEFGVSQPGVSQHLRVLRSSGFARVRADGRRRIYSLDTSSLREIDDWLLPYRAFWRDRLDALGDEIMRGRGEETK